MVIYKKGEKKKDPKRLAMLGAEPYTCDFRANVRTDIDDILPKTICNPREIIPQNFSTRIAGF